MAKTAVKKTSSPTSPAKKDNTFPVQAASPGSSEMDTTLQELFLSELKDMYWAENHLTKALPKMIAAAGNKKLRQGLTDHLAQTIEHVRRLQQVFDLIGAQVMAKKCDAMEGLTMSGEHTIENTLAGTPVRDLGLMMSGLKVENFEITTYTGMIQVATTLGLSQVAGLLQQNLDEEVTASERLSELSRTTAAA